METQKLNRTPLYFNHLELKAKMVPFAGYEMPVQYQGLLEETKSCRRDVGLFDVSHMGQFSIRGKNSLEEMQKLVTNDLSKIKIGQAQYHMLCNERGGVIDDLVIYRREEAHIYVCVNASNRDADFTWMKEKLPRTVDLEDHSETTSLLAVQGPKAELLLSALSPDIKNHNLKYYWAAEVTLAGIRCYLSRTGYTGEDGFEIYLPHTQASHLWNVLLEKGKPFNLTPCGLGARDTLRLEMGYPLHGHELSTEISPLQAGLSWVVKLKKTTPFIGQEALQKESTEGSKTLLRAYRVKDRRIARQGYSIFNKEGKKVGTITSGTHSPHLEAPIAMGFVERAVAEEETLWVEIRESKIPLIKIKLPFIAPHTKKI
ncbi:MAG: glycine cleavage system aminomethyltransferase GcvT [Proteobacteria bacterium]|nr:glycine cleavage system aminomethyltransferase GcvT [Pseudomonadota bacterium]